MSQWLDNIATDTSEAPPLTKVLNAKPEQAIDACWDSDGKRINEQLEFSNPGQCNALFPTHTNPRIAAGAPVADDAIKCALRRPERGDYSIEFSDEQWQKLEATFPQGVCDYSQAGQGQVDIAGTFLRLPL